MAQVPLVLITIWKPTKSDWTRYSGFVPVSFRFLLKYNGIGSHVFDLCEFSGYCSASESTIEANMEELEEGGLEALGLPDSGRPVAFLEDVDDDYICSICSSPMREPQLIPECLHSFCKTCLTKYR